MVTSESTTGVIVTVTLSSSIQFTIEMITWAEYLAYGAVDPVFGKDSIESPPQFSRLMFPLGANADFNNVNEKPKEEIITAFSGRFENSESRDIARCADQIIAVLKEYAGLGEGKIVADIGTGTGLFLEYLSRAVGPSGLVLANEVSPVFYEHLQQRIALEGYLNVSLVHGLDKDPHLPSDHSVDTVFICDVYHHFEYPKTIVRCIRHAMKPSGKLVVIDYIRDDKVHTSHASGWIMQHV